MMHFGVQNPKFHQFFEFTKPTIAVDRATEDSQDAWWSLLFVYNKILVTNVEFVSILDIMGSIGGIFSFLNSFVFSLVTFVMYRLWYKSIYNQITEFEVTDKSLDSESKRK